MKSRTPPIRILQLGIPLIALVVAAVLIGPGLIDWNKYKGEIAAQAKAITGFYKRGANHNTPAMRERLSNTGVNAATPKRP